MDAATGKSEYEIERGKPTPSKNHSIVQTNLVGYFFVHYQDKFRALSELTLLIDEKKYIPDVVLYEKIDFEPGQDESAVSDIPLCAIEILSPKQNLTELIIKSHLYFEAGVQSYWLILPDLKTVYVFSAPDAYEAYVKKGILKDQQLDIELDLEKVFR